MPAETRRKRPTEPTTAERSAPTPAIRAGGTAGLPSLPADVRTRPLATTDADALIALLLEVRSADGVDTPGSAAELRHLWYDLPGTSLAADTLVAVRDDGGLAGVVGVFAREEPTDVARAFMPGAVRPVDRGRGIGTYLVRWAEQRSREVFAALGAEVPRQVDCECPASATGGIALLQSLGYRQARSFVTMRRDLSGRAVDVPAAPADLTVTTWRPDLDEATRLAHNDAFRDHWGSTPLSAARWQHFVATMPGFRPDCSWLALAGREVVGYTLATIDPHAADPVGWLGTIGVRRVWRRRGIASALIAQSLNSFAAAGATRAGLDVDTENPSGAVGVYSALGFQPAETSIILSRQLDG
jgi:mycothiol synthase